jgi:hypothetical protein
MRIRRPSHPALIAYAALFVALGGVSYGAARVSPNAVGAQQITSSAVGASEIKAGAVGASELKKGAVGADQIADGSVGRAHVTQAVQALATSIGASVTGPAGAPGRSGDGGEPGERGDAGAPDTAQQVLEKVRQVDGVGSGVDADLLGGSDGSGLARTISNAHSFVAQGFPILEPLVTVPGFGTLRVSCAAWNNWQTAWESTSGAPTHLDSTETAPQVFPGDGNGTTTDGASSETWQTTLAGGGGMHMTVSGQGLDQAADVCRFTVVVAYEVP